MLNSTQLFKRETAVFKEPNLWGHIHSGVLCPCIKMETFTYIYLEDVGGWISWETSINIICFFPRDGYP